MFRESARYCVIILLLLFPVELFAQQGLNSGGGTTSGSGGSSSFSIGQMMYHYFSGTSGSVAHGVQQPFEFTVISGVDEPYGISLSLSVYPNPTTDLIKLKVNDFTLPRMAYQLFDLTGKLIESQIIVEQEIEIFMGNLPSGIYILRVLDGRSELKSFRIVKH